MDDWAKIQKYGKAKMAKWPIGTKVRLRMLGGKIKGEIIECEPPTGLLSPRYKCRWDNGDESGFLFSSDLIKL